MTVFERGYPTLGACIRMTSDWWKNTHGALLDDAMPPTLSKGKWDKLGDNIESIKSLVRLFTFVPDLRKASARRTRATRHAPRKVHYLGLSSGRPIAISSYRVNVGALNLKKFEIRRAHNSIS